MLQVLWAKLVKKVGPRDVFEGDKAERVLIGTGFQPAGGGRHFSVMRGKRAAREVIMNISGSLHLQSATWADPFRLEGKTVAGHRGEQIPPEVREARARTPRPAALVAAFRLSCAAPSRQWQLVAISIFFSMACGGIYEALGVIRFRLSPVVKGVERTSLSCALVSFDLIVLACENCPGINFFVIIFSQLSFK